MPMTAAVRTRIEKAAADNGFDLGPTPEGTGSASASSHAPLRIWLTVAGNTLDQESLDVFNGILLSAHLGAAFDAGLITIADDGTVLMSQTLDAAARAVLGLDQPLKVRGLTAGHRRYLEWHRSRRFKG